MDTIFSRSKLREVFFNYGKFEGDNVKAFIHAPFDRVTIGTEQYITTRDPGPIVTPDRGQVVAVLSADSLTQEELCDRDGLFFKELQPIAMGEHEMGDHEGRSSDWMGCFKLGFI